MNRTHSPNIFFDFVSGIYSRRSIWSGFLMLISFSCPAQEQKEIFVSGKVLDEQTRSGLSGILVVNKKTQTGSFADGSGNFSYSALKTDTILISSPGFQTQKICFSDSADKNVFEIKIILQKLLINLNTVDIYPKRELIEIEKDISRLKTYQKKDYMITGFQAVESPFTALYQAWSRTERNKRKVAEMRMEDKKKEVLRELMFRYSVTGVFSLPSSEFDAFIDFCSIPDEFLRTASQYQIILFFKEKFRVYSSVKN